MGGSSKKGGKSNKGKSKSSKSNNSKASSANSSAASSNKVSVPAGDSLILALVGSPATFELTKLQSFPATAVVGSEEESKLSIQLPSWEALDAIIAWFRDASDADHEASLSFSSSLAKQHRAKIHSAASAVGLGALVSLSRGVGEDRRITIARRGSTVAKEAAAEAANNDPELAAKAALLYTWALQDHVEVSRDESIEIMANNGGDNMPEALATVWAAHWPRQEAAERLCIAIAKNDLKDVEAAIESIAPINDAIATGSIIDQRTGVAPLHLAAGEGNVALVEVLLSAGFPVDGKDGAGATALDIARKYEHSDVQGVLLRAGAVDTEVVPTISESNSTNATITAPATNTTAAVVSEEEEFSENGSSTASKIAATGVVSDGAVTINVAEKEEPTAAAAAKKTSSKHGKFAVSLPSAVVDATAAVAAKAEDIVAYGKKALLDSTKAIENTKTATLSYGHKALDGGKAAVESSKAYTLKAIAGGKMVVSNAAEKADENAKVAVSWMKKNSLYILAGAGAVVATAGVVLAVTQRKNITSSRF
jgi:hypothetical protein